MTKTDKAAAIEALKERFENNEFFYIADASTLSAEKTTELRGKFFEKGISMQVVKNTLAIKALEQTERPYGPSFHRGSERSR